MKTVGMDIETDAIDATRIWVICAKDIDTGETEQFLNVSHIEEEKQRFIEYCADVDCFVFHNGIGFDVPVINSLLGETVIDPCKVLDTLIVSRLVDYTLDGKGHSLKAWGRRLGDLKLDFKDFSALTEEMIFYCHQDVNVTVLLYNTLKPVINDPTWDEAIRCEHEIQMLCEEMTDNGFYFDQNQAETLLDEIELRMLELTDAFQEDFPPQLQEVNRIKYRRKADGSLFSNVTKAHEQYEKTVVDWSSQPPELVCYNYIEFNPGSPKQRIERLWEAGWQPYEKTKGHIEYDREQKQRSRY
jgi:DNA polymerase-1